MALVVGQIATFTRYWCWLSVCVCTTVLVLLIATASNHCLRRQTDWLNANHISNFNWHCTIHKKLDLPGDLELMMEMAKDVEDVKEDTTAEWSAGAQQLVVISKFGDTNTLRQWWWCLRFVSDDVVADDYGHSSIESVIVWEWCQMVWHSWTSASNNRCSSQEGSTRLISSTVASAVIIGDWVLTN